MLADLAVLTPSLVVCVAFLIGVVLFLRRQMAPKLPDEDDGPDDISGDGTIPDPGSSAPPSSAR